MDAAPVVVELVDSQAVGVDGPKAVDPQPVANSSEVTGDDETDPMPVDDFSTLTDASGGAAVDTMMVEPRSNNAEEQGLASLPLARMGS